MSKKSGKYDSALYNLYMELNVPSLNFLFVYLEEAMILRRLGWLLRCCRNGLLRKQAQAPPWIKLQAASRRFANIIWAWTLVPVVGKVKVIQWRYFSKAGRNLRWTSSWAAPFTVGRLASVAAIKRVRPRGNVRIRSCRLWIVRKLNSNGLFPTDCTSVDTAYCGGCSGSCCWTCSCSCSSCWSPLGSKLAFSTKCNGSLSPIILNHLL